MVRQSGPGPAHYQIPPSIGIKDHNKTKWIMPAYTIGKRPQAHGSSISPGPQYMTRDQTRFGSQKGPAYSIKKRSGFKPAAVGPGPAAYSPKFVKKYPEITFGTRQPPLGKPIGPGPAGYNLRKDQTEGPAISLTPKPHYKFKEQSPGPAAYLPKFDGVRKKVRVLKFSGRSELPMKSVGPGPGAYNYSTVKGRNMPKFSFGLKQKDWVSPYITPEDNACIYKQ